ncbi:carbohydrate ABC transporter permease [Alkaliphilus transvaalensis]|uniref:carbohydrate ABC transporter permease n=1 Tax=Alkaliphilus transvaalensis TaxID=114628 RepID=UPI00047E262B|nr:sugar ABC transporter permease [Alkaliphilus transvaalensis]
MNKPKKAAILSLLFMGLGQFYNKEKIKGIIFAAIEIFILINIPYFTYSFWGLITLGETPQYFYNGLAYGDHSIFLLIQGIIAVLVIFIFILIYILNVTDAQRTAIAREKGIKPMSFKSFVKYSFDKYFPYIILTPCFILMLFLTVLPLLFSISIAFTNYAAPFKLPPKNLVDWVGFENFRNLVNMPIWNSTFIGVAIWTVIWAVLSSVTSYFAGLFLALLINAKEVKLKKFWRSIFILPYAIPAFISILVMRLMFTGLGPINSIVVSLGFERVPWLTNSTLAKVMLILVNIWLGAPYFMALMSGILTNVSNDLYEAADIDGATRFQKFTKITLPLVFHATSPLLILSFTHNFNNFMIIFLLTSGNPANPAYRYAGDTDILISWIYKLTLEQNQFHMASVVSILIFIFIATVSALTFSKTKSFKEEDLMQ